MQATSLNSGAEPDVADPEVDDIEPIVAGVAHDFGNILAVVTNYLSLASRRIDDPATARAARHARVAARRRPASTGSCTTSATARARAAEPSWSTTWCRRQWPCSPRRSASDATCGSTSPTSPSRPWPTAPGSRWRSATWSRTRATRCPTAGRHRSPRDRSTPVRARSRSACPTPGTGMPPEVVERAVEPRFSTRPKGQAAGLGLTIVDRVDAPLGGELQIESAAGRHDRAAPPSGGDDRWLTATAPRSPSSSSTTTRCSSRASPGCWPTTTGSTSSGWPPPRPRACGWPTSSRPASRSSTTCCPTRTASSSRPP